MSGIEKLNKYLEKNPNSYYERRFDKYFVSRLPKQDKILDFVIAMSQTPKNSDGEYLQSKRVKKSVKKIETNHHIKKCIRISRSEMIENEWCTEAHYDEILRKERNGYCECDYAEAFEERMDKLEYEYERKMLSEGSYFGKLFEYGEKYMDYAWYSYTVYEWAKGNDYN